MIPEADNDGRDLYAAVLAYHPRLRAAFDSLEMFQRAENMRMMSGKPPRIDGDEWKDGYSQHGPHELSAKEQQLKDACLDLLTAYVAGSLPDLDVFIRAASMDDRDGQYGYEDDSGDDGDDGAMLKPQPTQDGTHG